MEKYDNFNTDPYSMHMKITEFVEDKKGSGCWMCLW